MEELRNLSLLKRTISVRVSTMWPADGSEKVENESKRGCLRGLLKCLARTQKTMEEA